MIALGVDYAWRHPKPSTIAAAGYKFALRYLSHDTSKNLTRAEADALRAAGLDIGVVWETTANRALAGSGGGASDGIMAAHQADAAGAPPSSAIYFAVDFDAQPRHFDLIREYLLAASRAIAPHPAGVYGSANVVDAMIPGVQFGWQTAAWSRGRRSTKACLFQRITQVTLDGVVCDVNEQLAPFGGWNTPATSADPAAAVIADFSLEDLLPPINLHIPGLDPQGKGDWPLDGTQPDKPAVPAGKIVSVDINTNGHNDVPQYKGSEDDGHGHAKMQFEGPASAGGFDIRVWVEH